MAPKRISLPRKATPKEAIALQLKLAPLVSQQSSLPERISYVAGADGAYTAERAAASAVLTLYDSLTPIETASVKARLTFPYIPGLLAFREAPVVVRALQKLKHRPDVCIVDGHGLAHPRRFGLACYVGLMIDLPTIGAAKSRLFGTEVDDRLLDPDGNVIAVILRVKKKNLYVSVGHKVSLGDATRIVQHCVSERGLEPIRLAHEEANRLRWTLKS